MSNSNIVYPAGFNIAMASSTEWETLGPRMLRATTSRIKNGKRIVSGFFQVAVNTATACTASSTLYHEGDNQAIVTALCDRADLAEYIGVGFHIEANNDEELASKLGMDACIHGLGVRVRNAIMFPCPGTGFPLEPTISLFVNDFARTSVRRYLETGRFK